MTTKKNKTIIVLTGPTASGKTAAAIALAKYFRTEIISADSRQCFREMKIGVARPSEQELNEVPHHFIATHSITDDVTAAGFELYALELAEKLFRVNDVVLMAGGTGLYIKAFCEGLDAIPEINPVIRQQVMESYEANGIGWLQATLKETDPLFYEKGEMQNPQRMMRALEVRLSTGQSVFSFHTGGKAKREFNIIKLGVAVSREELHRNIHNRVDKMMKEGLADEVRSLLPFRKLNALQTVGYSELFDFFDGKITLEQAVTGIKTHTRQYAKRQLTWFRKDNEINWLLPEQLIADPATLFSQLTVRR